MTIRAGGALLLLLGVLVSVGAGAQTEKKPTVLFAEIRGTIDPATSDYLKSAIQRAEKIEAQALVVELDTPGGLVSSTRSMAQLVDQSQVPVVIYVTPAGASATSAGALLSLSSHVAAMAPGTNIGAAHPVGAGGEEIKGAMGEKAVADTAAFARGLAEARGRSSEMAELVVSKSRSFTAQEAQKQNLVEIIAESRSALLQKLHGRKVRLSKTRQVTLLTEDAVVQSIEMSWGQKVLHLLANPNVAGILMTLAMLLIYVEVSNPGITIAGVLGVICLLIALVAFQMLPIRSGALILVVLGMGMMVAEPFIGTGGILAGGGALAFLLGMLWLIDPSKSDLQISPGVWIPAGIVLFASAFLVGWGATRARRLTAETRSRIGGGGAYGLEGYKGSVHAIASDGMSGKAMIRGELWDFDSPVPVSTGQTVEVVGVKQMRAQVRPS